MIDQTVEQLRIEYDKRWKEFVLAIRDNYPIKQQNVAIVNYKKASDLYWAKKYWNEK